MAASADEARPTRPGNPAPAGPLDARAWLDQHGDVLYRFALVRTGDSSVAEELVQEALVAAWQSRDKFRQGSSERTWLVGILKHKVADHLRRLPRQPGELEVDAAANTDFTRRGKWATAPRAWGREPSEACQTAEFWDVFRECLEGLPPRLVFVFTERELGERDCSELCKLVDVTPTNLWTLLHRARSQLRRCLEVNWFAK